MPDFTQLTAANLNWEAFATLTGSFATLLAGGAAVVGAVIIGKRQAAILSRQIKLQEVETLSLLFDRRLAVYRTCIGSLQAIVMKNDDSFDSLREEMFIEIANARFIFDNDTSDMVGNIFKITSEYATIRNKIKTKNFGIFNADDNNELQDILHRAANMYVDASKKFVEVMSFPKI